MFRAVARQTGTNSSRNSTSLPLQIDKVPKPPLTLDSSPFVTTRDRQTTPFPQASASNITRDTSFAQNLPARSSTAAPAAAARTQPTSMERTNADHRIHPSTRDGHVPPSLPPLPTPVQPRELRKLMKDHHDADFLEDAFAKGFYLGFEGEPTPLASHNSMSVNLNPQAAKLKIEEEIRLGRIAGPFDSPPFPNFKCSPLALREKSTAGKYRLLHNLSFPYNSKSVNLNIPDSAAKVTYASLHDAFKIITQLGPCFLSKTDISDAFRLIPLHPSQYPLTGFKFLNKFYYDRTLPMGARSSCKIFERVSDALKDILISQYNVKHVIKVIDDFLFIAKTKSECEHALNSFQDLCKRTGFPLAKHKTVPPTNALTFLGLQIDTLANEASIPPEKINKYSLSVAKLLSVPHCSLRELKSVIGQLHFCCTVIPAGRCFLRRLYNLTANRSNPNSPVPLPPWAKDDLSTWAKFLSVFNGRNLYLYLWTGNSLDLRMFTDSCKTGYGGTFRSHFIQGLFPQNWQSFNIATLELYPIFLLVKIFALDLAHSNILFYCDNEAVVCIINNKSSKDPKLMSILRPLILCLISNNINFRAIHIPGITNTVADRLSRFQATPRFLQANGLDPLPTPIPSSLRPHNFKIE